MAYVNSSPIVRRPGSGLGALVYPPRVFQGPWPTGIQPSGLRGLTFDGTGLLGTGLFSSGLDISQWTIAEWLIVGVGVFFLVGGFKAGGSRSSRRKKLAIIRDKYALARDTA